MKDVVPSSFLREATALCHSPKSKIVAPSCVRTRSAPSAGERSARRACRPPPASAGTTSRSRSLAMLAFALRQRDLGLLGRFGLAVEQHLEQPAPEQAASGSRRCRSSSGSPRRRRGPAGRSCRSCSRTGCRRGARPGRRSACRPRAPCRRPCPRRSEPARLRRSSRFSFETSRVPSGSLPSASSICRYFDRSRALVHIAAGRPHRHDRVVVVHARERRSCRPRRRRAGSRSCRAWRVAKSKVVCVMPSGSNTFDRMASS